LLPPTTELGFNTKFVRLAPVTVSVAVLEIPAIEAVIVELVDDETPVVVMENDAEVLPEPIVTVAGTVTEFRELDRLTTKPDGPAGPERLTVPVELFPPTTDVGLSVKLLKPDGVTVKAPLAD